MTRELLKELLMVPATCRGPWIPGAGLEAGGMRPQRPLVASRSCTTDASFSCLLPSTLGKFIYLLFISCGGRGDLEDQGHGNQAIGIGGPCPLTLLGFIRAPPCSCWGLALTPLPSNPPPGGEAAALGPSCPFQKGCGRGHVLSLSPQPLNCCPPFSPSSMETPGR